MDSTYGGSTSQTVMLARSRHSRLFDESHGRGKLS